MPLIECVPNFSEGRRPEVIAEIVAAIESASVLLLDVSSDPDHNRTVVTFAGEPEVVSEGAFRGIAAASRLIDLETHRGEHPRLGAADVVPFVPLRDATMGLCVSLAHALGQRVGAELGLPVYFYEAAALHPERVNLANVRRGGYEALKEAIANVPARYPDAGPARLGTAGAVIIGAREPLIAFNVYLNTRDVNVAKAIAEEIRESSGGLPLVKALGFKVKEHAQVSINVIDYRRTSLYRIMEAVRTSAARYGVGVMQSELVGLIPQAALVNTALEYLQLPLDTHDKILENRIGAVIGDYREIFFE